MAGGLPQGKVATTGQFPSFWTDGRAVPLLTVSSARQAQWQQRQAFSLQREAFFQPSIQPHTHALRVLVGKFSHIHRGSRCSALSVAVRVRIPAMTPSVGRMLCTGDSSLSFCRCVAKRANREKRSVPLNRASRTAALALWKVKSCSQHSALPIGFHAAMGAAYTDVGNVAFRL